jgi:hypothetical protein
MLRVGPKVSTHHEREGTRRSHLGFFAAVADLLEKFRDRNLQRHRNPLDVFERKESTRRGMALALRSS